MQILLSTADLCQRCVFIGNNGDFQAQISWGCQKDQRPLSLSSPLNLAQLSICSVSSDTGKFGKTQCSSLPSPSPPECTYCISAGQRQTHTDLVNGPSSSDGTELYSRADITPPLVHMPRLAQSVLKLSLLCRLDAAPLREGKRQGYMIQYICFAPGGWGWGVNLTCFRLIPCTDTQCCHKTTFSTVMHLHKPGRTSSLGTSRDMTQPCPLPPPLRMHHCVTLRSL